MQKSCLILLEVYARELPVLICTDIPIKTITSNTCVISESGLNFSELNFIEILNMHFLYFFKECFP